MKLCIYKIAVVVESVSGSALKATDCLLLTVTEMQTNGSCLPLDLSTTSFQAFKNVPALEKKGKTLAEIGVFC